MDRKTDGQKDIWLERQMVSMNRWIQRQIYILRIRMDRQIDIQT